MIPDAQGAFINYYEILAVAEDAPSTLIQQALQAYRESLEARLNNPLSMGPARSAMNEIVPAIEQLLLQDSTRAHYDQQLAAFRNKQIAHYEPADDEGLDEPLRIPFLFNPFDNFDTELPGHTLRLIAMKLDTEWAAARTWITDTSDETHGFISYLTFVANRTRLAEERIGEIIKAVAPHNPERMDTNEGIERCINILDPRTERPRVGIHNMTFDGKILDAGSFISDQPAQAELILGHEGVRGCVFGSVTSHTSWLTFANGQSSVRFALMPQGTEPTLGPSQVKIPLSFAVSNLTRNTDHSAQLIVRLDNQVNPIELPAQVLIHIPPLPPRVRFEPEGMLQSPAWAGRVRRGVATSTTVMPRNHGDESLVPLKARISTRNPAASVSPGEFHANEPITIAIDTSKQPFGQKYHMACDIDYVTPGAIGPKILSVQGEILPTIWQSMLWEQKFGSRLGAAFGLGIVGLTILGALGSGLATHINIGWLLLLLMCICIPALFGLAIHPSLVRFVTHMQRAGNTAISLQQFPFWQRWGLPLATGLVLVLVCLLIDNPTTAFLISGSIGFLLYAILGFMLDSSQKKTS